jgi:hypothetical protein
MNYPNAETLLDSYQVTHMMVSRMIEGLTHADSVVQPPFKGNALNWVVGHIVAGRNEALLFLGAEPVWGEEELTLYRTGSEPITGEDQGLTLEELRTALDQSEERLEDRLSEITDEELEVVVDTRFGKRPLGEHISGLHWHETYHTGQVELLKELAKQGRSQR